MTRIQTFLRGAMMALAVAALIVAGPPVAAATRNLLSTDIGVTVLAYDAGTQAYSALTTAANKGIYYTAADTPATYDLTAFGRTLGGSADAAAGRSNLGLATRYVSSGDTSNSSNTTYVLATGLECTGLAANTTYLVQVWGRQYAAASTTGIVWRIGDGTADNDGSGTVSLYCRNNTTGTSEGVFNGTESPGLVTACQGSTPASTTSAVGNAFNGTAIWTTDASPSSIGVYFMSEVSSSQVTVVAKSVIQCLAI